MHHIKRLVLGLCLIAAASLQAVGQCTPDSTTSSVPALYPDTLANGTIGQAYSQVITVVIPQDTTADVPPFGTLTFDICELQIDSIPNLPDGLAFDCLAPNCVIQVNHDSGVVNRTCVELFGTPTDSVAPDDTLNVFVSVVVGNYDAAMDTCMPVTIALPPELTTIQYRTRFLIQEDTTTVSIDQDILNAQSISLYPNPSLSGVSSLQYQLSERADVNIRMTDLTGRVIMEKNAGMQNPGQYVENIGQEGLSAGMYLVSIDINGGATVLTRKLMIQ